MPNDGAEMRIAVAKFACGEDRPVHPSTVHNSPARLCWGHEAVWYGPPRVFRVFL